MSIQYTVLGFELTTFWHESPPITTIPGLPKCHFRCFDQCANSCTTTTDISNENVWWGSILCLLFRAFNDFAKILFFKIGQSRPLFLFIFVFSTCYNINSNWKKHRWCAWDSNPGWQDGRRERTHWATLLAKILLSPTVLSTDVIPAQLLCRYCFDFKTVDVFWANES